MFSYILFLLIVKCSSIVSILIFSFVTHFLQLSTDNLRSPIQVNGQYNCTHKFLCDVKTSLLLKLFWCTILLSLNYAKLATLPRKIYMVTWFSLPYISLFCQLCIIYGKSNIFWKLFGVCCSAFCSKLCCFGFSDNTETPPDRAYQRKRVK